MCLYPVYFSQVDLFSHDMLLVPIHLGMHWCMSVVDFKTKCISYYDSMLGNNEWCLQVRLPTYGKESFLALNDIKWPFWSGGLCEGMKYGVCFTFVLMWNFNLFSGEQYSCLVCKLLLCKSRSLQPVLRVFVFFYFARYEPTLQIGCVEARLKYHCHPLCEDEHYFAMLASSLWQRMSVLVGNFACLPLPCPSIAILVLNLFRSISLDCCAFLLPLSVVLIVFRILQYDTNM